jgi:DNA-directed RNA polymerase subunit RPC12/RpoP
MEATHTPKPIPACLISLPTWAVNVAEFFEANPCATWEEALKESQSPYKTAAGMQYAYQKLIEGRQPKNYYDDQRDAKSVKERIEAARKQTNRGLTARMCAGCGAQVDPDANTDTWQCPKCMSGSFIACRDENQGDVL